jgi:hypothetical protein
MSQQELLRRAVEVLEGAGIPYMATGSLVSSVQGEPRSTHDIDLIVQVKPSDARALVAAFPPPDFYLDEHSIRDAIAAKEGMFNLLDAVGGDKVDFWVLKDHPFDRERFARRYAETVAGVRVFMSRPEDTILAKLRWSALYGPSEKQVNDALRVYEVQHDRLDLSHIERWADELGVRELWERIKSEAEL